MRLLFAFLSLFVLNGCATNFEPAPLLPEHPASVLAQEAPRSETRRLIASDALTRKSKEQLSRDEVPNPDFQGGGRSHDMGDMKGMDHSKMPGMEMNKPPADAPSTKPVATPIPDASPANKEAVETEMKKTSDEMKNTSDELKDEAKHAGTKAKESAQSLPAQIIYTCVMHPEVQQLAPGKCPKCGMTLVKKEGGTR